LDRAKFDKLMVCQLPDLLRFAVRLTGDAASGEDLLHDAIEHALRSADKLRQAERLKSWIFAIIINSFRDRLRRSKEPQDVAQQVESVAGWLPGPIETIAAEELGALVAAAVSRLPPRQREVVVLVAYEGFSTADAAVVLGITDQNARTTLHLARECLRERLARHLPHNVRNSDA
jgi:RNA polymerase sigma-70 factor (ECF subfamily)